MSTLVFDIGGTSMRMAVGEAGVLRSLTKIPTPKTPAEAVVLMVAYKNQQSVVTKACGGIAGIIVDGTVATAPHLPAWDGYDVVSELQTALGIPVHIENDAELAALGEATYGAGKDYDLVAYLGIGTGIGGALITNKQIAPNTEGFEPGHQILDIDTGDTFEGLVSGSGLHTRYGKAAHELPRTLYQELTTTVATGIYNVLLTWSPEVLVLGGSLMNEENGYRIHEIEQALKTLPGVLSQMPVVVPAALGDECGLYGALALSER